MPTIAPPADRLAPKPRLKSAADVDRALAEIAWCDAFARGIEADCNRDLETIKAKHATRMVMEVGGEQVALLDRRAALVDALEAYCTKAREALLSEDKKSREFTHGSIGWRKTPAKIDYREGSDRASFLRILDGACQLVKKITAIVEKAFPLRRLPASTFVDVKIDLSRVRTKKAVEDGTVNERELKALGLEYLPGDDEFYITVGQYVQRESEVGAA